VRFSIRWKLILAIGALPALSPDQLERMLRLNVLSDEMIQGVRLVLDDATPSGPLAVRIDRGDGLLQTRALVAEECESSAPEWAWC
jgi:hypothetical protein